MALEMIKSNPEFVEKVTKSKIPVLLKFGASWCAPCKSMAPILDMLEAEYDGKIAFYEIDIDVYRDKVLDMEIRGVPSIKLFRPTNIPAGTLVGAVTADKIRKKLDPLVNPF